METPDVFSRDYKLDVFDTYSFLIISPFAILTSLILVIALFLKKELRKQPGDLILMISISELFLSIFYLATGIRTTYVGTTVQESSTLCSLGSIVNVFFSLLEMLYNICFISHILFTMKAAVRKSFVPKKIYHVCNLGAALALTLYYCLTHSMGKTPYGICSMRVGEKSSDGSTTNVFSSLWPYMLSTLFALSLGLYVLYYTHRFLPSIGQDMNELKRDFKNYYQAYIKASIVIWVVLFISHGAQLIGTDESFEVEEAKTFRGVIFNMGRIGNTAKVMMPLLLFFIRIQDPLLRKYIWAPVSAPVSKVKTTLAAARPSASTSLPDSPPSPTNKNESNRPSLSESLTSPRQTEDLIKSSANMAEEISDPDDLMWMNLLPSKVKEGYTRTFLACINHYYEAKLEEKKNTQCLVQEDIQDVVIFDVDAKKLQENLGTKSTIVNCKFTIYCPAAFREIIQTSHAIPDFGSLDIELNQERIKKAGESGGGASGELFLFSYDSKLILKTATSEEVKVFQEILLDYKEHLRLHKTSQIGRIFGLFDFSFAGSDKSIKLILMENLFRINGDAMLRKYDMKGSKHSRRVLKSYKDIEQYSKVDVTMKDLDFKEIDKELKLSPKAKEALKNQITLDVRFFTDHRIIDYSIILAVIDRELVGDAYQALFSSGSPHFLEDEADPRKVYLFGIIDYFQLYTWNKSLERFFKRLTKCNPRLDTSSQPPKIYSTRFIKWVDEIIQ